MDVMRKLLSILFALMVVSCGGSPQKMIEAEDGAAVSVLENPYPLNYPSTNPKPNKVVYSLKPGESVLVLDEWADKDFKVYKVQYSSGKDSGYVIYGKNIRERDIHG